MGIIPFEPGHLRSLALQESQAWMSPMMVTEYGDTLKNSGSGFTLATSDKVIACAGIAHMWENRGHAWALISADAGHYFTRIFRAMRTFLDMQDTRRIEATVDIDFEQGHRLMKMLRFEYEGVMRAYLPNGQSCALYGRIK